MLGGHVAAPAPPGAPPEVPPTDSRANGNETALPVARLERNLARSIRQGHPWIYRDAIAAPLLPDGAVLVVHDRGRAGRPLAVGFWDASSPIAVRVVSAASRLPADAATLTDLVAERLATALRRRLGRLDRATTNAFRWVHGEADGLPGIHLDVYGDAVTIRYDGAGARAFYTHALGFPQRLLTVARAAGLRLAGGVDRETRTTFGQVTDEREVLEDGLRFVVDLARGQKGGLFLDQRDNRLEIRKRAAGRTVLNLFGYTGGFSIYAAAGGARRTDTVDLARPAIEAAAENFRRNGLDLGRAGLHAEDAFAFLERAIVEQRRWDIVISDPPSFAPRKSALPAARRSYRRLHRLAAAVTSPDGLFCPASCSSHFPAAEFLPSIEEGCAAAGRVWHLEELRGAGFDHPVVPAFREGDYLKFALGRVPVAARRAPASSRMGGDERQRREPRRQEEVRGSRGNTRGPR
jgi:23S rRNA (cytosine1962-C5)-methyltransferase